MHTENNIDNRILLSLHETALLLGVCDKTLLEWQKLPQWAGTALQGIKMHGGARGRKYVREHIEALILERALEGYNEKK